MTSASEKTDIITIIKQKAKDERMPCSIAFKLVSDYGFFPDIVGLAMNNNKIKISECQLGLFGHNNNKKVQPAESVASDLKDVIYSNLEDGKLPCASAWNIANEMKISKIDVACACEKLQIKIYKCQLGAF